MQALFCLVVLVLLSSCAGNQAMQWRPPREKPCGVLVCHAPIGESRVDRERDCRCSGKSANQVLRDMGMVR